MKEKRQDRGEGLRVRVRLGISSCLLGEEVRYDGGHKLDLYLRDVLGGFVEWVPVCPEVGCGLPVPREAMRLVDAPGSPRLVTRFTHLDHTDRMLKWTAKKLSRLEKQDLCGFVFKARSPSCGMERVKVYSGPGPSFKRGSGLFAKNFRERFPMLPAEDEGTLSDPGLRENFIERVFVYCRWQDFLRSGGKLADLVAFHAAHKYLIMSHSPRHLRELGRLVAAPNRHTRAELCARYLRLLMDGLRLRATRSRQTNVLQHLAGYFKARLLPAEKQELVDAIDNYRRGLGPLIVPLTLLQHYAGKYDERYLGTQIYLHPHPAELMLRNRV